MALRALGLVFAIAIALDPLTPFAHVCRMGGGVRLLPCCCAKAQAVDASRVLAPHGPGCCERIASAGSATAKEPCASLGAFPAADWAFSSGTPAVDGFSARVGQALASRGPPPATGPPIYLRVRSLLI